MLTPAIAKSVGIDLGTSSMLISSFAATPMIQSLFGIQSRLPTTNHRDFPGLYCCIWQCMVLL